MPDLHVSQGILISHLIQQGFCEPKNLCMLLWVHVGVSATPHVGVCLCFRLGRGGQGDDNGVLSLELAGKHF